MFRAFAVKSTWRIIPVSRSSKCLITIWLVSPLRISGTPSKWPKFMAYIWWLRITYYLKVKIDGTDTDTKR